MKKIYSLFTASLALTVMMSSCSSDNVLEAGIICPETEVENSDGLVPIELQTPVLATTRASINPNSDGGFTIPYTEEGEDRNLGVFCLPHPSGDRTWESDLTSIYWKNRAIQTEGTVDFNIPQSWGDLRYYPRTTYSYMFASYYPYYPLGSTLADDEHQTGQVEYVGNKVYVWANLPWTRNYDFLYGRSQKVDNDLAFSGPYFANTTNSVKPVVQFKHAFMRFNFVFADTRSQPQGTGVSIDELYVNDFKLYDIPYQGKVCIVDNDGVEDGRFIPIMGWDPSKYDFTNKSGNANPFTARPPVKNGLTIYREPQKLTDFMDCKYTSGPKNGEQMDPFFRDANDGLIVPVPYSEEDPTLAENYEFTLRFQLQQKEGDTYKTVYKPLVKLRPQDNNKWEAGKSYKVVITINSIQDIAVQLQLEKWDDDTEPIDVQI